MDNKKFKVGDRVYVPKDTHWIFPDEEIDVPKGTNGIVLGFDEFGIVVGFEDAGFSATISPSDVDELVEKSNDKDAFLFELQALLRKYDAEICTHIGEDNETYADKVLMYIQIGTYVVNYEDEDCTSFVLSADNIMDYDKE